MVVSRVTQNEKPTKEKELEYKLHGIDSFGVSRVKLSKKPMKEKELEYQLHCLARLVASRVTQSKKPYEPISLLDTLSPDTK